MGWSRVSERGASVRPVVIRASSVCLLLASALAAGCGMSPDEVGSVVAGAIKPDAFAKLQDYYGTKSNPVLLDPARGRPVPRRKDTDVAKASPDEAVDNEFTTAAVKPPPIIVEPKKSNAASKAPAVPVESKKAEPKETIAKAPPVIVEPVRPLTSDAGIKAKAAAPAIKPPPVIVEPKKAEPAAPAKPPVTEAKAPPVIIEKKTEPVTAPAKAPAAEVKAPPVIVEPKKPEAAPATAKATTVSVPPAAGDTKAAAGEGVPAILSSREKSEQAPKVPEARPAPASVAAKDGETPDVKAAQPAKTVAKAERTIKRKKGRWIAVSPTEAELSAAAQKAPPLPMQPAAAPNEPPAGERKQWVAVPPSERELPAANANSPVYALPPTATPAPAPDAQKPLDAASVPPPQSPPVETSLPAATPEVQRPLSPPITAALPSTARKITNSDGAKPKEPMSFREECLKRAADQAAADDVQDEGVTLDEKLAIDALCQKVLQRTAVDPVTGEKTR